MGRQVVINSDITVLPSRCVVLNSGNKVGVLEKLYYPGCLKVTMNPDNPETYLGFGTWELWGQGRVPMGVSSVSQIEETGGQPDKVIPAHTHTYSAPGTTATQATSGSTNNTSGALSNVEGNTRTGERGFDQNYQPSIAVNIWKRTDFGATYTLTDNDKGEINNTIIPGDIWLSASPVNPFDVFGFGYWQLWGEERIPVCIDIYGNELCSVEDEFGTFDVEVPYHNHVYSNSRTQAGRTAGSSPNQARTNTIGTRTSGSGGGANIGERSNAQPYIYCAMWRRIG